MTASPVRVGVLCDYPEEGWESMDLVGEMILDSLQARHAGEVDARRFVPRYRERFARLPGIGRRGAARNADRLLNRLVEYPRALRRVVRSGEFDLYHLVDHSYSQLVHALPPGRSVVTCHDLDTFRCLLDPAREPRPRWFRAMARHILDGFSKAAAVACVSEATRDAILAHGLIPPDRLHVVPNGLPREFQSEPDPAADAEAQRLLGPPGGTDLLHVGTNIARKRVDVLLHTFAAVRRARPDARLIKVGGALPPDLASRAQDLGVAGAVVTVPRLTRPVLAAVYRRASLVLLPSEAEGFGLPAVEALACGAPLLASDLPVLREVGGEAPVYAPVADLNTWAAAALALLDEPESSPSKASRRAAGLDRARLYSWDAHADRLVAIYRGLLGETVSTRRR